MRIGNKQFDTVNKTYIMGILNVTPDSFSDGGKFNNLDNALRQTDKMIREGADIIDVGGESTRPGHLPVSEQEEIERIVPVIEKINNNFAIPISIDTYKSKVAWEAIKAGAVLVNDIWGLKFDGKMADVIAENHAVCCLMHNRREAVYQHFVEEVLRDLESSLQTAHKAGIEKENIILDPGIGFGKTYEQNLLMLNKLHLLSGLGYPVLLGASRKSVIGLTLDLPVTERLEGTLVTTVFAVAHHCSFVRVHDVKENKRVIDMADAILRAAGKESKHG